MTEIACLTVAVIVLLVLALLFGEPASHDLTIDIACNGYDAEAGWPENWP